jgi:predicted NBD/HSP70 family sugar kinase
VNLFDPQLVVVGGEMGTMFGEFLVPAITRMIRLHARYFREVDVAVSQLGRLAVAVGACAFLM